METLSKALNTVNVSVIHKFPRLIISFVVIFVAHRFWRLRCRRSRTLPRNEERVLVIGASSGIGRAIALQYAAAGSRVCIVGRREHELTKVADEYAGSLPKTAGADATGFSGSPGGKGEVLPVAGDFTQEADMLAVRDKLEQLWGGIDTLVVCAGVSALRPLLEVAGLDRQTGRFSPPQVDAEGVQRTVSAANAAMKGNFFGPLVCAVVFIPFLSSTSNAPSILLMSSLAAVCPAPTRALYTSTKASSLLLYQSLAIEHPSIAFSFMLPATVEGDFRASAVDGGQVREADPNKHGLGRVAVAQRAIVAIDCQEKFVFMPSYYGRAAHFGYWLLPSFVEKMAGRKYNFA